MSRTPQHHEDPWVARLIAGDRRQGFGNWTNLLRSRRRVTAMPLILCLSVASGLGVAALTDPAKTPPDERMILSGQAQVIDGDTFEISGTRIRHWGIDAPEIKQTCEGRDKQIYECGRDAAAALSDLTRGQYVECDQQDRDRYLRIVAVCRTGAGEINAAMVQRGWAVDSAKYSHKRYATEEKTARAAGAGIWSGRFEEPSNWRREHR